MINLGELQFRLSVPSVDADRLESMSNELFDEWAEYVGKSLALEDYSLFLLVEEGSINGWGKIKTGAQVLFIGISAYGGLYSGLEIIGKQLVSTKEFLAEQAKNAFSCSGEKAVIRKSGGVPASLQRLFFRVQRGELAPHEATILAEDLLTDQAAESPDLLDALSNAFRECPRLPEQIPLPLEEFIEEPLSYIPIKKPPNAPKRRKPELPQTLHYRVEVWRDSKLKRKQSKLSPL